MSENNEIVNKNITEYRYKREYILRVLAFYIAFGIIIAALFFLLPSKAEIANVNRYVILTVLVVAIVSYVETKTNLKYVISTDDEMISHIFSSYILLVQKNIVLISNWKDIYAVRHIKKYFLFDRVILFSPTAIIEIKIKGLENYKELLRDILEKTKALSENVKVDEAVYSLI